MNKKNIRKDKMNNSNTNSKDKSSAIDKKTEFVNGLGASAEFTSVD